MLTGSMHRTIVATAYYTLHRFNNYQLHSSIINSYADDEAWKNHSRAEIVETAQWLHNI